MKKINKMGISTLHLIAGFLIFAILIFLVYKVVIKYAGKKTASTHEDRRVVSLFKRVTISSPTPLYATPDAADLLVQTIPVSTLISVEKTAKNFWTFYKIKVGKKVRWIKSCHTSHVPVKIGKGTNLKIGTERVDKTHPLPYSYKPTDLKRVPRRYNAPRDKRKHRLRKEALIAFVRMFKAARREGIKLYVISAFRTPKYQMGLYLRSIRKNNNPDQNGTAKPTYSEHQLGTAVDLTSKEVGYRLTQDFEKTKAFRWLKKNMARFNMILSYPKGNAQGYIYEPWHLRYMGKQPN